MDMNFVCPAHEESPITEKVRETLLTYLNEKSCEESNFIKCHIFFFSSDTKHQLSYNDDTRVMVIICYRLYSGDGYINVNIDLNEPVFSSIQYDFKNKEQLQEFFERLIGDNNEIMSYLFLKGVI